MLKSEYWFLMLLIRKLARKALFLTWSGRQQWIARLVQYVPRKDDRLLAVLVPVEHVDAAEHLQQYISVSADS